MAFNRLSILDLNKRSDQPYKYKNLILCFNGEIYNYKDLRVKLKRLKVKFHTNSDTEVLIKYLYYFGIKKTLNDIEGMWSFSLFNKKNFKLILCRDYYGEKPLYYLKKREKFFYGSEVPVLKFYNKAKLKIDLNYVKKYLFFEYRALNANNNLLYKEIDEVKPGTYLEIDAKFQIKIINYHKPQNINKDINYKNYIKKVTKTLTSNFKNSLTSDRPLALTLSGGIDSSGIASIIKKIKKDVSTFTIFSNDKNYDEFENVKKTVRELSLNINGLI